MSEGFPLLTTKKMYMKGVITELLWFLRGDTNIKFLVDNDCHIWDGDAYKNWCKQFEVDPNNFDGDEIAKGHNDQCWGYPILDHVKSTSKEYKRGQINAYLEGKAEKPFFYLTQEEFINKIKTDEEFAEMWGELGPIYGKQWRSWESEIGGNLVKGLTGKWIKTDSTKIPIDQIANLIRDLKTNPDSRRLMVNAWNVGELDQMVLPPCHYGFQVYTRELSLEERKSIAKEILPILKTFLGNQSEEGWVEQCEKLNVPTRAISLMYNARSQDVPLGTPFNISSYALLLEIIGKMVNMVPDELIANMGDCHIYLNQIDGVKEQIGRELTLQERRDFAIDVLGLDGVLDCGSNYEVTEFCNHNLVPKRTREPYPLPTLKHMKTDEFYKSLSEDLSLLTHLDNTDFVVENYQSYPTIKMPLSN
jgi:thymidylate synthase